MQNIITTIEFFKLLPGSWSFTREINNFILPELSGTVIGTAIFARVLNHELHYTETGKFNLPNSSQIIINKEYFYSYNQETNKLEKYFVEDNRKKNLFYIIDDDYTAKHECINDNYAAFYNITDQKQFELTYHVSGPNKAYKSKTIYNR